ncbi:dephospho-CoA kinase [Actomonas aquatica]|uniref:Dephospho-CoA kinase n=1 Tax=Actomonas aquatica TaxID=2866162 RepID=A0ABZ1C8X1_9BACT|nr:dephospho-CoA kinase [Opitutus sp. WL0086]WRQ88039.1 dephospho-CoA kinase [Opitutus sp. WL0086]
MTIGVTGGMGCGKSTVTKLLAELGYPLIDSDQVVRDEILTDPEVVDLARQRWGAEVLTAEGLLDRAAIAQRVFADAEELEALESWVHPRLYARWRERMEAAPDQSWVIEVPLLFEKGLENWFDFIVCVASSADVQLARLTQRGVPHALAEQRISKQLPLARKTVLADLVLWNDGTLPFLREQVDALHEELGSRQVNP